VEGGKGKDELHPTLFLGPVALITSNCTAHLSVVPKLTQPVTNGDGEHRQPKWTCGQVRWLIIDRVAGEIIRLIIDSDPVCACVSVCCGHSPV